MSELIVWQPSAVQGLSALTASVPLETWKDYLRFHSSEAHCAYLPNAFVAEHFAFHGRVLSGTPQLRVRWKRAVIETNDALGEAVGKLYVAHYFPPAEKARAQGHGAQPRGGVRHPHRPAGVDEPGHARESQSEACHAQGGRRLPGSLA